MRRNDYRFRALFLAFLILLGFSGGPTHAQLVADGASFTLDGTTTNLSPGDLRVGDITGNTTLVITNGGILINREGVLGYNYDSHSNVMVVTGSGSLWSNTEDVVVGNLGSGNKLVIANGGTLVNRKFTLGFHDDSHSNVMVVTGPGSLWSNTADVAVGDGSGGNKLIIENGAKVSSWGARLGDSPKNEIVVSGPGTQWINGGDLLFGGGGWYTPGYSNTLLITDGAFVTSSNATISISVHGSNNVVTVSGTNSVWDISGNLDIGLSYASHNELRLLDGGTLRAAGLQAAFYGKGNLLRVDGGALYVTNETGTARIDSHNTVLNSGSIRVNRLYIRSFLFNGGTLEVDQCDYEQGALYVGNGTNTARLILGDDTYHNFEGGLYVRNNAKLTCNGHILSGPLTARRGSEVILGDDVNPGRLLVTDSVKLDPGTKLTVRLNSPTPISGYSQLESYNNYVDITGTLLNVELGYLPEIGTKFTIINRGSRDWVYGTFSGLGEGASFTLGRVTMRVNYEAGTGNNDTVLTVTDVAPPPSFSETSILGSQVVVEIQDGIFGKDWLLHCTSNLMLPLTEWEIVDSGVYGGSGNTIITNMIPPNESQRFYRIVEP